MISPEIPSLKCEFQRHEMEWVGCEGSPEGGLTGVTDEKQQGTLHVYL